MFTRSNFEQSGRHTTSPVGNESSLSNPIVITPTRGRIFFQEEQLTTTNKDTHPSLMAQCIHLSPMEMMERFATIAKASMSPTSYNSATTMDALHLLASNSNEPYPMNPNTTHVAAYRRRYVPDHRTMSSPSSIVGSSNSRTNLDSGTRKRNRDDEDNEDFSDDEIMSATQGIHTTTTNLTSFSSFAYITQLDTTLNAAQTVHQLTELEQQLEKCSNARLFLPSYQRFCVDMHNAVTSIHTNTRSERTTATTCYDEQRNDEEIPRDPPMLQKQRFLLDQLYRDAIEHVRILLLDAKFMMQAKTCSTSSTTTEQGSFMDHASYNCGVSSSDAYHHLEHENLNNSEGAKKKVADYMTNWLRRNWINPYPDESCLEQMAKDCGTSKTVVNNWLINSRTRKWRPAIAKAYELGRPTVLLKEDSIRIFDGKPLQELKPIG